MSLFQLIELPNELLNILLDVIDNSMTYFNILQTNSIFDSLLSDKDKKRIKVGFCTLIKVPDEVEPAKEYCHILPNGHRHGELYHTYKDRDIVDSRMYYDNKKYGPTIKYYYNDNNSTILNVYETGQYDNNKKEGIWIKYHVNGEISSVRTYTNGVKLSVKHYGLRY